jgi:hypothetical protein
MDDGAVVGWEHRYRKASGEVSAIQCAYNIICDDGEEAFAAECQNEPIKKAISQYEITPELVSGRLGGFARLTAPQGADIIVAAADVNFCGLNWQLIAMRPDAAGWVLDYGKEPEGRELVDRKRKAGITEEQAVAGAIVELASRLNGCKIMVGDKARFVDCMVFDCGFMTDTVFAAVNSLRLPMRVFSVRGFAAQRFRIQKDAVKFGNGWYFGEWTQGKVFCVNADYWREQYQRAFLLHPGVPGSLALYGDNAREHTRYAQESCCEKLVEHVSTERGDYYNWHKTPGVANDLADAGTYALALASAAGANAINAAGAWRPPSIVAPVVVAQQQAQPAGARRNPQRVARVQMEDG